MLWPKWNLRCFLGEVVVMVDVDEDRVDLVVEGGEVLMVVVDPEELSLRLVSGFLFVGGILCWSCESCDGGCGFWML